MIYTNQGMTDDTGISAPQQYFWEAFPAGSGEDVRTTYLFTYIDANEGRPSLTRAFEDYWTMLKAYQGERHVASCRHHPALALACACAHAHTHAHLHAHDHARRSPSRLALTLILHPRPSTLHPRPSLNRHRRRRPGFRSVARALRLLPHLPQQPAAVLLGPCAPLRRRERYSESVELWRLWLVKEYHATTTTTDTTTNTATTTSPQGALTRHLGRLSTAVGEALTDEEAGDALLSKKALSSINPYMPNLSATWMFQRSMSARVDEVSG